MSAFVGLIHLQNMVRKLAKDPLVVIMVVGHRGDCSRVQQKYTDFRGRKNQLQRKFLFDF